MKWFSSTVAFFSLLVLWSPAPAQQILTTPRPDAVPTQTASAAAPSAAISPTTSSHYVIGMDDVLQVAVWKEPGLSGTFPVRPDGMISLVLLGDLPAAGLTPTQLGADITTRLKKYIQDPNVTVLVTAVNSQRIFMLGEVARVGPMVLAPGMTLLQAISTAGGLSLYANAGHIYVLRGEQGKQQKIPFNYKQALKGNGKQEVYLLPGDTVVVP